jgi:hypothetical protein
MYSIESLNEYCAEHKVILNAKYDSANRDTRINGNCLLCPNTFDKTFRRLKKVGAYCPDCSKKLGVEKNIKHHTDRRTDGSRQNYNYLLLDEYCKTNKVKIEGDYNRNINRNTMIKGNCTKCETKFDKTFRELIKIGTFCADCALEIGKAKIIETTLLHHGVEYSMQSAAVREKSKITIMEKYGYEYASQMPETKEKIRLTSLSRYGVEHPQQSPEIRMQTMTTNMERYGVCFHAQNENVKRKIKATIMTKYGVDCTLKDETIQAKAKATNLRKYGVSHYAQNPECFQKSLNRAFATKQYPLPSGRILNSTAKVFNWHAQGVRLTTSAVITLRIKWQACHFILKSLSRL